MISFGPTPASQWAAWLLWRSDDHRLGQRPGPFSDALLDALELADADNADVLLGAYPAARDPWAAYLRHDLASLRDLADGTTPLTEGRDEWRTLGIGSAT